MPESVTAAFSEPEDFEVALRSEGFRRLLVTSGGRFRARFTRVSLNRVSLSAAEEKLPRIGFVEVPVNTLLVSFAVGTGPAPICGGIGLRSGELFTACPREQFHARIGGPSQWGTIRLPLGVSERRLRQLCAAHLGMSPTAYDRLQRMAQTRRTLRKANGTKSVSAIARFYGYQDPGRFAINYRAAFDESPSATLRKRQHANVVNN